MQGKWEVDLQSAVMGTPTAVCVCVFVWGEGSMRLSGVGNAVRGYHRAL